MTGQARRPTDPLGDLDDLMRRVYILETHRAHGHDSYELLGRTTLDTADDAIPVSGLALRKFLIIRAWLKPTGGTININLRFNNDSGVKYARRASGDGASPDAAAINETKAEQTSAPSTVLSLEATVFGNVSGNEKVVNGHAVWANTAGAGTAPSRREFVGKYIDSAVISVVNIQNTGTGSYDIGSEVVVLGHD